MEGIQLPLPQGWLEEQDDEGDSFYVSPDGESQWERPKPSTEYLMTLLPEGWECGEDEDGDVYFISPEGESQWEPPEDMIVPDPFASDEADDVEERIEETIAEEDEAGDGEAEAGAAEAGAAVPVPRPTGKKAGGGRVVSISRGKKAKEFAKAAAAGVDKKKHSVDVTGDLKTRATTMSSLRSRFEKKAMAAKAGPPKAPRRAKKGKLARKPIAAKTAPKVPKSQPVEATEEAAGGEEQPEETEAAEPAAALEEASVSETEDGSGAAEEADASEEAEAAAPEAPSMPPPAAPPAEDEEEEEDEGEEAGEERAAEPSAEGPSEETGAATGAGADADGGASAEAAAPVQKPVKPVKPKKPGKPKSPAESAPAPAPAASPAPAGEEAAPEPAGPPSIPRPSPIRLSGWITKGNTKGRSWKRRFFVLDIDKGSLDYYADDTSGVLKGGCHLKGATIVDIPSNVSTPTPHAMGLQPKSEDRIYYLCFGQEDHRDAWLKYIRINILAFATDEELCKVDASGALVDPSYSPPRVYVP